LSYCPLNVSLCFQYDKAKTEKEKIELNALKLNRDLDKVQMELNELREIRGLEDVRGAKEKQVNQNVNELFTFSVMIKTCCAVF